MTFKNDMLNSCWLEDIYIILIALKNGKCTKKEAMAMMQKKHRQFKEHGNYSGMDDVQLWAYCKLHENEIIRKFENIAA